MAGDNATQKLASVEALLGVVERLSDDERARTTALTTRASSLAGFSGTILSVIAAFGREILQLDLGSVGEVLVPILFVLSVVALGSSATLAVGGALRGRKRALVDTAAVTRFAEPTWVRRNPADIKHGWLVSSAKTLATDRSNNDSRAKLCEAAAVSLLVGVLLVAAQAVVLGVDELAYPPRNANLLPIAQPHSGGGSHGP